MAMEYTRQYPHHVSHLILTASTPFLGEELHKKADIYFEESTCPERKWIFAEHMRAYKEKNHGSFIEWMVHMGPKLWYEADFDPRYLWKDVHLNTCGAKIIWGSMFAAYDCAETARHIIFPVFLALGCYDYFNPPIYGKSIGSIFLISHVEFLKKAVIHHNWKKQKILTGKCCSG